VTAKGRNWRAGDHIRVTWKDDGHQLAEDVTVNERGEFSVVFTVPADVSPGTRTIYFTALESRYFLQALFTVSDEKPIPGMPFACPVYFLGLHGTNQGPDGSDRSQSKEINETLNELEKLAPKGITVEGKSIEYNGNVIFPSLQEVINNPALESLKLAMRFINAKNRGVKQLDNEIVSIRNKCSDPKIVLTGYSLGAWIIDYWLIHHQEHWPYIRGIVLYGDPQFIEDPTIAGLARLLPAEPLNPAPPYKDIMDRWLTLCLDKDPVCGRGYSAPNVQQLWDAAQCDANRDCEHKKYVEKHKTVEGSKFLAQKVF
jgi:cutinase